MVEKRDPSKLGSTLPANFVTSAALATGNHLAPTPARNTPDVSAMTDQNASPTPAAGLSVPMARIDDTSSVGPEVPQQMLQQGIPSVGVAAARLMVLEPDKERWRQVSRDWYLRGLAFTPGAGKLHHHLGEIGRAHV